MKKHVAFLDLVESETWEHSSWFNIERYCETLWDEETDVDGPFNLLPTDAQPLTAEEIEEEDNHIANMANDPVYRREYYEDFRDCT